MVLIFSKVQRCNIKGAPNGFYGYKEEFDAPAELAKQLVDANVAGYVVKSPAAKGNAEPPQSDDEVYPTKKEMVKEDEAVPPETEEVTPEPDPVSKPGKKSRR
jgi:hypothetical protein